MGKLDCLSPVRLQDGDGYQMLAPCNHCLNCSIKRQLSWTLRICLEQRASGSAVFVTHTYDETSKRGYLEYRDMQLCLKRLRKKLGTPVRFFSTGQYGSKTGREHWHTIYFGVSPVQMATILDASLNVTPGQELQGLAVQPTALWPHGSTHFADFNIHRARYTARYALRTGPRGDENVVQMSRRPGIGLDELQRIGRYLAEVKPEWERVPGWWKIGPALYPLDQTARQQLSSAFEGAGGVIRHKSKSALVRDTEARLYTIIGDPIRAKPGLKIEALERSIIERSPF